MKVCYFLGSLNAGGTERLILDVCRNHADAPYQMVCLHRKGGSLLPAFVETGVAMQHIPNSRLWLRSLLRLRQFLLSEQINVIHAQTPLNALLASIATFGTSTAVVTTMHGFEFLGSSRGMQRKVFGGSKRVVFVSHETERVYRTQCHIPAEKCRVVYNGIDFTRIPIKPISSPTPIVKMCMVGSFRNGRNQYFICQFLKRLHDTGIAFQFSFIGPQCRGEEQHYQQCVDYCQQNGLSHCVAFLGARNDVPQLLQEMDAYLYASDHDTFGISIAEAIAAGLPTFVNNWPVANEITLNGKLAHIYRSHDTEHLLQQFLHFLQHREEEAQQAHNNAHEIRNHFSITQHIQNLNNLYNNL